MALIKCEDCGHEVSTRAIACPNCGCPVISYSEKKDISKKRVVRKKEPNKGLRIFRCSNCHHIFYDDLDECPYCYTKFNSTTTVQSIVGSIDII